MEDVVFVPVGRVGGETDERGEWRLSAVGDSEALLWSTPGGGHPKYLQGWYRPPHMACILECRSMANAGSKEP